MPPVTKMIARAYPGEQLQLVHRLDKETSGVLLDLAEPRRSVPSKWSSRASPP